MLSSNNPRNQDKNDKMNILTRLLFHINDEQCEQGDCGLYLILWLKLNKRNKGDTEGRICLQGEMSVVVVERFETAKVVVVNRTLS